MSPKRKDWDLTYFKCNQLIFIMQDSNLVYYWFFCNLCKNIKTSLSMIMLLTIAPVRAKENNADEILPWTLSKCKKRLPHWNWLLYYIIFLLIFPFSFFHSLFFLVYMITSKSLFSLRGKLRMPFSGLVTWKNYNHYSSFHSNRTSWTMPSWPLSAESGVFHPLSFLPIMEIQLAYLYISLNVFVKFCREQIKFVGNKFCRKH